MNIFLSLIATFLLSSLQDSSKTSINDSVSTINYFLNSPTNSPNAENDSKPWWSELVYIAIGAFLGFGTNIVYDIIKEQKDKRRVRKAIISEIKINSIAGLNEHGNISYPYVGMWHTDIYKSNLEKITYFNEDEIQLLVIIYGKIDTFREGLGDIDYEKRKQVSLEPIQSLAKEIRKVCENFLSRYDK